LVGHDKGHSCCWCQVQGNELTLLPHPLSHRRVRHYNLPKEASVIGRVTNSWRPRRFSQHLILPRSLQNESNPPSF
jgi:hypothetical protein